MSTYLTVEELIELPLLGNNDLLKRNRMRYLKWAKFVAYDLNLSVLKIPQRQYFYINKRTNTIELPCEYTEISSVNLVDDCGNFYPVWKNERLTGKIADVAAGKDCSCEYKCGYQLCNTIKGYEATTEIITDKMPDGSDVSFTCVNRKVIESNGTLIEQKQYPQRIYESGVWVDTILYTENIDLCKVELDSNGCVCDTEQNIDAVCGTCCNSNSVIPFGGNAMEPPCPGTDTWRYYCNSKLDWFSVQCGQDMRCYNPFQAIFNISEDGNRLIFPRNFGFKKVLIRWYGTPKTSTITMPLIAAEAFAMGLKFWDVRFDDKQQQLASYYSRQYSDLKWGLFSELNRRRIAEYRMILTPPTYMPSYINQLNINYNNSNYGY